MTEAIRTIALRVKAALSKRFDQAEEPTEEWAEDFADSLLAEVAKQAKPAWYAVMSKHSPIINKAIRAEEVANEYADKASQNYSGVEVVPLFEHPSPDDVAALKAENKVLRDVLSQVKEQCLFVDDDGQIGVSSEAQIDSQLFGEICEALAAPKES